MSSISARFQKAKAKGTKRRRVMPKASLQVSRLTASAARDIVAKGSQLKVIDFEFDGTDAMPAIPSTGTSAAGVRVVNSVVQGTGISQRTGTKIKLKNCTARFVLDCTMTPSTPAQYVYPNYVRIMCVWWPEGGTIPTQFQLTNAMRYDNSQPSNKRAGKALNAAEDFTILVDDTIEFNFESTPLAGYAGASVGKVKYYEKFVDLSKREHITRFNGTASPPTAGQIAEGCLVWALAAYQNDADTTVSLQPESTCRIRFTDL